MRIVKRRGSTPSTWHRPSKLCGKGLAWKKGIREKTPTFTILHQAIKPALKAKLFLVVSNAYYVSSLYKTTTLWFKTRLHVCTHYNLTLQGTTMFAWKFIAHNYQSPMTYIFLTDFQEASFVCCRLMSHSVPAPLLDWRHICKQISPKLPNSLVEVVGSWKMD